jgi:hypothetical protein
MPAPIGNPAATALDRHDEELRRDSHAGFHGAVSTRTARPWAPEESPSGTRGLYRLQGAPQFRTPGALASITVVIRAQSHTTRSLDHATNRSSTNETWQERLGRFVSDTTVQRGVIRPCLSSRTCFSAHRLASGSARPPAINPEPSNSRTSWPPRQERRTPQCERRRIPLGEMAPVAEYPKKPSPPDGERRALYCAELRSHTNRITSKQLPTRPRGFSRPHGGWAPGLAWTMSQNLSTHKHVFDFDCG